LELAKSFLDLPDVRLELSLSRESELIEEFRGLGVPVHETHTYTGKWSAAMSLLRTPWVRRDFQRLLVQRRFDVVACTMSHLWNPLMISAVRKAGARFLLVLHDAVPHPGENYLVRKSLLAREIAAADGIVVLAEHVRNQLQRVYGYPAERTWVIPHGVFAYHSARAARSFPKQGPVRLLFFGRLLPYKGLDLMLSAFRMLRSEFPRLELVIAGPGDPPAALTVEPGSGITLDNRWIPEEEIGSIFQSTDVVVVPYIEASQSGVVAVAYASGLPVVATPVGGLVGQVRRGETGVIANDVSAAAVASAIRTLLCDPPLYEKCSAGALLEAETTLAWPSIAMRFADAARVIARNLSN
jgi:glycosyltransferase involved in cell wall biosynthesis